MVFAYTAINTAHIMVRVAFVTGIKKTKKLLERNVSRQAVTLDVRVTTHTMPRQRALLRNARMSVVAVLLRRDHSIDRRPYGHGQGYGE